MNISKHSINMAYMIHILDDVFHRKGSHRQFCAAAVQFQPSRTSSLVIRINSAWIGKRNLQTLAMHNSILSHTVGLTPIHEIQKQANAGRLTTISRWLGQYLHVQELERNCHRRIMPVHLPSRKARKKPLKLIAIFILTSAHTRTKYFKFVLLHKIT